jgi:hypothetical protein
VEAFHFMDIETQGLTPEGLHGVVRSYHAQKEQFNQMALSHEANYRDAVIGSNRCEGAAQAVEALIKFGWPDWAPVPPPTPEESPADAEEDEN